MILIYTHTASTRLEYICEFIFKDYLGVEFEITTDEEKFKSFSGNRINYSNKDISAGFKIESTPLLFEKKIKEQKIQCFEADGYIAFLKINKSDIPFDIFAASFYLLSRYEEYLPHKKDLYGRFAHENSLAFKEGFLTQPLINIWLQIFSNTLKIVFEDINFKILPFNFLPTYDIDIGWSYKNKGFARNLGGFIRSPSLERIQTLSGLKPDPYNSYHFLNILHQQYQLKPIYFFLVARQGSRYDKNITPQNNAMQQLVKEHASKYTIGLHPSWKSNEDFSLLQDEKKTLEIMCGNGKNIIHSRQHYIKFNVVQTPELLIKAGIKNDYSMGYGSINGFRASVASSFYFYSLVTEEKTSLRIHPFCYMDANSFYEQHLDFNKAYEELEYYYNICKKMNGQMITIFHNNILGTEKKFTGWKEMYEKFISTVI